MDNNKQTINYNKANKTGTEMHKKVSSNNKDDVLPLIGIVGKYVIIDFDDYIADLKD